MPSQGLSGIAVGFMAVGGILVYAGYRGISPKQALKDIGSGKPPGVESNPVQIEYTAGTGNWADSSNAGTGSESVTRGPAGSVTAAAQRYINDKYSQLRRQQVGYSDCSSFVDKILTDIGIPPPVKWAATVNYASSPEWQTIPRDQAMAGDIALSVGHIVILTGPRGESAIGQQNSRSNVRSGSVDSLMSRAYVFKKYAGKR